MKVICLGAGQDVGRSCVIVSISNYTIMFDCGMHMNYNDSRRFPDFSHLGPNINQLIDCVIISHFHLDHCGAIVYFTETIGYKGPIYMTHPTKAICPILLEDYRKILLRGNAKNVFTSEDITRCMEKVRVTNFYETIDFAHDCVFKFYPAGHVLGAAMIYVKVRDESLVYTGDYNMTPDRHLGSARIECLRPDLLITESTYGSTIRECRKAKEREFLNSIYKCVKRGGKVLIPVFALGRAQEMCLLIDSYWERMNLKVPIYLSTGMTDKANEIYKLFINYTSEAIRKKIKEENLFAYKHIQQLDKLAADSEGPAVIFASPGMLHSGLSLNIFLKICEDEKNMVIIPGYCARNTVGYKVLNNEKAIEVRGQTYNVNLEVKNLAFSAHADAKGILELIKMTQPRNVMLVHGDKQRMTDLKKRITQTFSIPTFMPENKVMLNVPESNEVHMKINQELLDKIIQPHECKKDINKKFTVSVNKEDNSYKIIECEDFITKKGKQE